MQIPLSYIYIIENLTEILKTLMQKRACNEIIYKV